MRRLLPRCVLMGMALVVPASSTALPLKVLDEPASATVPGPASHSAAAPARVWQRWLHLPGVFDLAGPRRDGRMVAAVHGRLMLVSPSGATSAFAPSYSVPDGPESYIALLSGFVGPTGCRFAPDDIFALDLRASSRGITKISAAGLVSHFATIASAPTLSGIAFDTAGMFGHRLLVIGPAQPRGTQVWAVDCRGTVTSVRRVKPPLEGGIAVAPLGFGPYGGQLIAANELDGSIYAISPTGGLSTVAASGVPAGRDLGVESVGFVPTAGPVAAAYVADRGTPGNPHPGTDSVLRLRGHVLFRAGVRRGDLLVATEGGATLVDVRCSGTCHATLVASGPPPAHPEGKVLVLQ